jgi:hypothetical protein
MRTALPTDLLLRLINAPPQQYAPVERIADSMTDPRARRLGLQDALNGEENEEI